MVVAKSLNFAKGTVVVMDRGYIDYKLFARWTKAGIFFVTRLKENANYWDLEDWPLPKSGNVLKDQLIRLNPITPGAPCREDLRLVTVWDERNQCGPASEEFVVDIAPIHDHNGALGKIQALGHHHLVDLS